MDQTIETALADILANGNFRLIEGALQSAAFPEKAQIIRKSLYYWGRKLAALAPKTGNAFYGVLADSWISFSQSSEIPWPVVNEANLAFYHSLSHSRRAS